MQYLWIQEEWYFSQPCKSVQNTTTNILIAKNSWIPRVLYTSIDASGLCLVQDRLLCMRVWITSSNTGVAVLQASSFVVDGAVLLQKNDQSVPYQLYR